MPYVFDETDGIIIGGDERPYEFWIDEPRPEYRTRDGKRRVAKGWFINDEEATAWFKENYPTEYRQGVEMRVWE